jgi:membrane protease YdiL (CAAX protease family)
MLTLKSTLEEGACFPIRVSKLGVWRTSSARDLGLRGISKMTVQNKEAATRRNLPIERPITAKLYLIGLLVIFACAYSQYAIKIHSPILGMIIVYGIPILATGWLWGRPIIRNALAQTYRALKLGLGFFGAFTALGIIAGTVVFFVIVSLDPRAVNLLDRPNPVLQVGPEFAWIMVGLSFLVVGPAEEYLFRGFLYGALLSLFEGRHWLGLAFVSSVLFAAVHLYYGFVYGVASLVPFIDLVTFGMAMAVTYYLSGGNLLIPALIHGAYDATGFLGVATLPGLALLLRGLMILIGILTAVGLLAQKFRERSRSPKQ